MNGLGETIDKKAKRLYLTTREMREIGLFRTGFFEPVYYITVDRVVVGVFTNHRQAEERLSEMVADIGSSEKS